MTRAACFLVIALVAFSSMPSTAAISPTWARKAVAFPSRCEITSNGNPGSSPRGALEALPAATSCRPKRIPSPDGKFTVEVRYTKAEVEKGLNFLVASFLLRGRDGAERDGAFPAGFQDIDLLWSPDSKAFFVNGGNGGGYWGFYVYVYRISDPALEPLDVTGKAQEDMLKTFPPCLANGLEKAICHDLEKQPDSNMSGIDWAGDSSAVVVMAEVPCSGGHGGIMCQVMGYTLEVPTGRIIDRLNAVEFKRRWQRSMAWRFHDPGPPEYCADKRPVPNCRNSNR